MVLFGAMRQVGRPRDLLSRTHHASDEIMRCILRCDREQTFGTVARQLHDLLEAESCGLFLVPEDAPKELHLVATYSDAYGVDFKPVTLKIQSVAGGGLTGHLADQGEIAELHGEKLRDNPYVAGRPMEHLASGKCFALLVVPVKGRHDELLGLLKLDNKKNPQGQPDPDRHFGEEDRVIGDMFASKIALLLESLRAIDACRKLTSAILEARQLDDVLGEILQRGLALLRADRGDFAWWDEGQQKLILRARLGEGNLEIGQAIPPRSIMQKTWKDKAGQTENDVAQCPDYYLLDRRTQSEITELIKHGPRALGVLNAESFRKDHFDGHDRDVLQLLAEYAAIAVKAVGKEVAFRDLVERLAEQPAEPQGYWTKALEYMRETFGFDVGLVYIPDEVQPRLRCVAWIGCDGLNVDPSTFGFRLDETALATKVFNKEKPYFSPRPWEDPEVSQRGVEAFQIKSPLLGLPLIYREKVLGALVAWTRRGPELPTRFHLEELKPLAVMASVATAIEESERYQHRFLQLAIHRVKSPLQSILGCVEKVMPGGRATEEERAESLGHLQEETKDLDRLIVRAARYTRLWREPLTLAEVDLRTLVKAAAEGFESQARQKGVELEVTLPERPCPVCADHAAIKEALANLIDNALKFSPAQAAVKIELGTAPDLFKISVTDRGPGFSADQRYLMLEPFASSIPPGGKSAGSGLGLPIARTIVDRHGGKLDFSQGPGGGSCFWFTLPISPIDSEAQDVSRIGSHCHKENPDCRRQSGS